MFLLDMVRDKSAARANTRSRDRPDRSTHLGSDHRSAHCAAAHELGLGMVPRLVRVDLRLGVFM